MDLMVEATVPKAVSGSILVVVAAVA